MRTMYRDQAMGPNQYFLQDKFGNYVYAYANQNSEKMEKGDQNSVKGHYAYIMSNGQKRRNMYMNNDMSSQMVNRNMMSQDMYSNMMNGNMMGRDMSNNMMYRNMMSNNMMNTRDMMD